jgi:hypothetical protein
MQRYTIRLTQIDTTSFVMASGGGAHGHWMVGRDAALVAGSLPGAAVSGPVVLFYGLPPDTARPFGEVALSGAVVLHVLPPTQFRRQIIAPIILRGAAAGARGWILVSDRPAQQFAAFAAAALRPRTEVAGLTAAGDVPIPIFEVRDSTAAAVLGAADEDLATLRAPGARGVRALAGVTGAISVRRTVHSETAAPNVIGILEGSDPDLRREYVFFTAHMDHLGVGRPVDDDSIYNGADDNASGTAGVVELAEAYAALSPRPRRSMVFMTVSGEERGLWGSRYYAEHPTLPLANTVADINLDMIGRNWRDTIAVIGKEHSTLGEVANRVAGEHPELHLRLTDDLWPQENYYFRSDHYNFARRGVPILFFFNGVHADYHRPSDTVDRIDAEKEARIVRMIFYIGLDVANAAARPEWNPESRRRIVEAAGR